MNTNQVEVFMKPPVAEKPDAWLQIGLKLLDWPFLLFIVLILFIWLFREQLRALFNRENILIKWGDKSILLRDLGKNIEQDVDSKFELIQEEQETPKKTVSDTSAKKTQGVQFVNDEQANTAASTSEALNRMKEALMSPSFRWRTLSRLAAIACISELEAKALLPSLGVDFDVNKSGQPIVKLKSR
jgi:hypothetical protein